MAVDPRANHPSASVTEVDFRSGQAVDQSEDASEGESGRELQIAPRYDDFAWQAAALEQPSHPRNTWLQAGLAVIAVAGFGAVLWFTYQWGLERGYREEVPIVRAESGPIKIRPEDPGGLVVPNQDKLVLNQPPEEEGAPTVERLLSAPEAPQPLPAREEPENLGDPEVAEPETAEGEGLPEVPAEPAPAEPAVTPSDEEAASSELAEASEEPDATPPEAAEPGVPPDVAPSAGGAAASSSTESSGTGASSSGTGGAEPVQLAAIKQGDYVIQLASVTSGEAAEKEWARLQKAFPALLGDMNLSVQVATVNGTEYHRIQTGPFPTRATALDMCAQIKAQNQACIVQRR